MSAKEPSSSLEGRLNKIRDSDYSSATENGELLSWLDKELNHLFKEFLDNPARMKARPSARKASLGSNSDTRAAGDNSINDLSSE